MEKDERNGLGGQQWWTELVVVVVVVVVVISGQNEAKLLQRPCCALRFGTRFVGFGGHILKATSAAAASVAVW